jgi:hypothetical protein
MRAPEAAPAPILGSLDKPRTLSIAFDVAAHGQKMGVVLYDERLETPLIEMPAPRRVVRASVVCA